jgi:shikimate kinase
VNVWLVGMPGSGKSTVGRAVAARLGARFEDADSEIERRAGRSVAEIFGSEGEEAFRRLESEVLADLAEDDGLVVSCGGGVVLDPTNREVMRGSGTVVLLEVPAEALAARLEGSGPRPVLAGRDPGDLWAERAPTYRAAAHHVVDASGSAEEVADRVLGVLR